MFYSGVVAFYGYGALPPGEADFGMAGQFYFSCSLYCTIVSGFLPIKSCVSGLVS
jgi:hypothetical protein